MANLEDSPRGGVVSGMGDASAVVGAPVLDDIRAEIEAEAQGSPTGGVIGAQA